MYITPGQGQTSPRIQRFDAHRNVFSLHSFVASFKQIALKSDFYAPNLKEVEEVYWFGPVRASVRPLVTLCIPSRTNMR